MKLYVGTYGKYAAGSLAGKWMDLDKFANGEEFAAACRRIHADERDPELMFQDVETDPGADWQEGLYNESRIPFEYWELKREFSAQATQTGKKAEKAEQDRLCTIYTNQVEGRREESPKHWEKWWSYYRKNHYFYTLSGGELAYVDIPSIETRFCEGEDDGRQKPGEPGSMEWALAQNAKKRTERGFVAANLEDFDRREAVTKREEDMARQWIDGDERSRAALRNWHCPRVPAIVRSARGYLREGDAIRDSGVVRIFTPADFQLQRKAVAHVRRAFEKRLRTWWKRFGADHIHTWTYWTEA